MYVTRPIYRMARYLFALTLLILVFPAEAQVLPPNGSVSGTLNATTNQITYTFTATQDGDGTFTITPSAGLQANIQFFDSDGGSLRFESPVNATGAVSAFVVPHLNAGTTYFFHALRRGGAGTFTLSNVYTPDAIANDAEPNNGAGTAISIAFPTTRRGHLGYSRTSYNDVDPEDWYKFTVPQDGDLTLTVTPTSTLQVNMQFFDSDGGSFRFESPVNGTGAVSAFAIPHLNPGTTYFLRVMRRGGYGGYTLTSSFSATSFTNDTEPNNGASTALSAAFPVIKRGHLGYSRGSYLDIDPEDWYAFTVPQDGDLGLTVTPTATLQVNVQFYDSDGGSFRFESPVNGTGVASAFTVPHLNAGTTYFFRVLRRGGYGSYTLNGTYNAISLTNDSEPNNGAGAATIIGMPTTRTGHLGYSRTSYFDVDPEDWYKFTVPQDGDLSVKITPSPDLQVNIQFFDSDGGSFRFESPINATGAVSFFGIVHLNPGTSYFLRVYRRGGYGSYTLAGVFSPASLTVDKESNDGAASALDVLMPDIKTGHLGYSRTSYFDVDGQDWYRFKVPVDSDLQVNLAQSVTLQANLQFFDTDGGSFRFESPVNGTGQETAFTIPHLGPDAGYFLRVLLRGGYGSYEMNGRLRPQYVVNDQENNDGAGSATLLTTFDGLTGHLGYSRGSFFAQDDQDWYRFQHPGGPLTITLLNTSGLQSNMQLFASDGGTFLVESPIPGAGGDTTLNTNRAAGTYYLRVLRRGGYGAYGVNPQGNITISGVITLEDCVGEPQPVTVEVRPQTGNPMVFHLQSGSFTIPNLPRQPYAVSFQGSKWLGVTELVDSNIGNIFIVDVLMRAGDANDDNSVDVSDLDFLIAAFDACEGDAGFLSAADFNCDGCVDVFDLDLVIRNFDRAGDD